MKDLPRLVLIVLAGFLLMQVLNRRSVVSNDGNVSVEGIEENTVRAVPAGRRGKPNTRRVAEPVAEPVAEAEPQPVAASGSESAGNCYPRDQLSAEDLLPKDNNSQWAEVNPEGQGELKDRNFVEAGWHFGINTVGQSLRNANLQIRSEVPNPQVKVSPWNQSTIGPDTNRQSLEIGGEC